MKFVRLLVTFVILAVMGIIMLVTAIKDKVELAKPRGDLVEMTAADFRAGQFVEGTIEELWDGFGYITDSDSGRETTRYYALPLPSSFYEDEPVFIALAVKGTDKTLAERMVRETDAFYEDGTLPTATMHVEGKVSRLRGEMLDYFKEYVEDMGGSEENMIAFAINNGNAGGGLNGLLALAIGLSVIGVGGTAFIILRRIVRGK